MKECVYAEMLCSVGMVMVFETVPSAKGMRVCRDALQCAWWW